jgi:hypothetical protein
MRAIVQRAVFSDKIITARARSCTLVGLDWSRSRERPRIYGEMAEWLKAHAWKACLGETLTWVRIPLSPP